MVDYCTLYVLQEFRDCIVSEADWKEYSMWGEETSQLGWNENGRDVCWVVVRNTCRVDKAFSVRVREFGFDLKVAEICCSF